MANAKNWFSITAKANAADIFILDEIGAFGVTAKAFIGELQALGGRPFTLHVNSPGGDMFAGLAIYNAIDSYRGQVTAVVEGVAASAASFISMAADKIVMPSNSMMMLHEASVGVIGGVESMREGARILGNLNSSMANAYAAKSGLTVERVKALMAATTWMTAEEALALGFADEVRDAVKVAASFDLSRYPNAPVAAPTTMAELAASYWHKRGKGPANPEDVSDLVPEPITAEAAFANFHGRFAGRNR